MIEPFYRLFMLDKVPNTRLLIGVGFASILQLVLLVRSYDKVSLSKKELGILAATGGLSAITVMLIIGNFTIKNYPIFISSHYKATLFGLWISLGVSLILYKRFVFGIVLLVAFSFLSAYRIHPLYRGLTTVTESKITKAIEKYPKDGSWVTLDDRMVINFPVMAGKDSVNAVNFYPQLDLWHELDTTRQYDQIYNRFAHVLFVNNGITQPFELQNADIFLVRFEPCQSFLQRKARYILSPKKLDQACVELKETITLPAQQFFIYRINKI